ncbi:hypothetical protein [Sorangium sp. So ce1182]|uniref:hypothetical protein n=1 Tax=Sorangium sp. So ce1182 TaxID=3133334 RepID=UPI003F63F1E9
MCVAPAWLNTCGNGAAETGEDCDDGNRDGGDGCGSDCVHCGDGEVTGDEVCDPDVPVTTSCVALRYDLGRPGCGKSCDDLSAAPCGSWSWREEEPITSQALAGVWQSGPQDVFVVGAQGTILHHNGQRPRLPRDLAGRQR